LRTLGLCGPPSVRLLPCPPVSRKGDVLTPSPGAIPPLAELQAQLWVSRLVEHHLSKKDDDDEGIAKPPLAPPKFKRSRNAVEHYELDYALHPRGGYDFFVQKLGVDHEALAYQLALDMGSAPRASYVLRKHGWKVFFTWAMGPNFNTKFRLVGPWAVPEQAAEIMRTELFDVVKRTGGVVCKCLVKTPRGRPSLTRVVSLCHLYCLAPSRVWFLERVSYAWPVGGAGRWCAARGCIILGEPPAN
jgi:hypothetical protein